MITGYNLGSSCRMRSAAQVTKVKLQQKQAEGIAEARSGRRSPVSMLMCCSNRLLLYSATQVKARELAEQQGCVVQGSVWGSGSAGVICAGAALLTGNHAFWQVCRF